MFAIPKKEVKDEMGHFYNFEEDNTHQADILFLPHDKIGKKIYAYALIVVDIATGDTDGEPMEYRDGWKALHRKTWLVVWLKYIREII